MAVKVANNAYSTLASGINNAVTSLSVATGEGARFPTLSGSDVFYATLISASNTLEIVKVTARATDTFTIVRAQDGTAAAAFSAGDRVELRVTAATWNAKAELDSPAFTGTPTSTTPAAADNSTKIATTAFLQTEILPELYASRMYTWSKLGGL